MTPAMAAVSNTPPMKPPVAAPVTAPVIAPAPAPAPAQAQPSNQGIDVHLCITIQAIQFILITNTSISHYNLNILFNAVESYLSCSAE